jgi:hypothetical protein
MSFYVYVYLCARLHQSFSFGDKYVHSHFFVLQVKGYEAGTATVTYSYYEPLRAPIQG